MLIIVNNHSPPLLTLWLNTSTRDSTNSLGKYLSALRHIEISVQKEEESAKSHATGEVVSLSLTRVICNLPHHVPKSNICGLSPPAIGWDRLPPTTNISIADDIVRVKYYGNTVYSHASQAYVDDSSFSAYWQKIGKALVRPWVILF